MRVISIKKLRQFWSDPKHPGAEAPLRAWNQVVRACDWRSFADVRRTYNTADRVGNKIVFDVGGNKYQLIAVIDFEGHKVFVRHVLDHAEYDRGNWKQDRFGDDWVPRRRTDPEPEPGAAAGRRRRGGRERKKR